jgi:hypothetical protein
MAVKPNVADARWATDETNNDAPSSGQRDTGWTPGQIAVSDYFNVLGLEAYKWFLYLSDGDLDGDFSIDGNLEVIQDLIVGGDFEITGELYHGPKTIFLPASKAACANNSTQLTTTRAVISTTASRIESSNGFSTNYEFPLDMLREGDRILEIVVYGREGNAGGETYTGRLYSVSFADSTKTGIGNAQTSGTTNANTSLQWDTGDTGFSPDGYLIPADTPLVFSGEMNSTSADSEVHIHGLEITYDRPRP